MFRKKPSNEGRRLGWSEDLLRQLYDHVTKDEGLGGIEINLVANVIGAKTIVSATSSRIAGVQQFSRATNIIATEGYFKGILFECILSGQNHERKGINDAIGSIMPTWGGYGPDHLVPCFIARLWFHSEQQVRDVEDLLVFHAAQKTPTVMLFTLNRYECPSFEQFQKDFTAGTRTKFEISDFSFSATVVGEYPKGCSPRENWDILTFGTA